MTHYPTDITGTENVVGTDLRDSIAGNDKANFIDGGKNRYSGTFDRLRGYEGNDTFISHHVGDDIHGGTGDDRLISKVASDGETATFTYGKGEFNRADETGTEYIQLDYNGSSNKYWSVEHLTTTDANDIVHGNDSDNIINVSRGDNQVYGNGGNDVIMVAEGDSYISGGEGIDTYAYTGGGRVYVDLKKSFVSDVGEGYWGGVDPYVDGRPATYTHTLNGVENILGHGGWDIIHGDDNNNVLNGGGIIDDLYGRGGNDTFVFSRENQRDKSLLENNCYGQVHGGKGFDALDYSNFSSKYIPADPAALNEPRSVTVDFQQGKTLFKDDLRWGWEQSRYADTITLNEFSGIEAVYALDNGKTQVQGGSEDVNVYAGIAGELVFKGGSGDDTLYARKGYYYFDGGSGNDTISFELTDDSYLRADMTREDFYAPNVENVIGNNNENDITGTDGDNILNGLKGHNTIKGQGGNDTLINYGTGALYGGTGNDTFVVSNTSRNILIQDRFDDQADHLVFDGILQDDIILHFDDDEYDPRLEFKIRDENDQLVTLAKWAVSPDSVSQTTWQPLLDEITEGISQIAFIEEGDYTKSLNTPRAIYDFLIDKLVYTEDPTSVTDARGRMLEGGGSSTAGHDIIYGAETGDSTIIGGEGDDILVSGQGTNTITASADDIVEATQGNGTIRVTGSGVSILLGANSGDYAIDGVGTAKLIISDVSVKYTLGDKILLGNGSTISLAPDSIDSFVLADGTEKTWSELNTDFSLLNALDKGYEKISVEGILGYHQYTSDFHITGSDAHDVVYANHIKGYDSIIEAGTGDDEYIIGSGTGKMGTNYIYDAGGRDYIAIEDDFAPHHTLFRRVDDNLEIIYLDSSSEATIDSAEDKIVVVNHFEESGDHAVELVSNEIGGFDVRSQDINKLVEATATFLAESGADDNGGSLVIGDNYNQLSQLTVNGLA